MTRTISNKIEDALHTSTASNNVNEIREILDCLYKDVSNLNDMIEENTSELSDLYRCNIRQDLAQYKDNELMHLKSKKVDNMINEYNNLIIIIELLEKKLSILENI